MSVEERKKEGKREERAKVSVNNGQYIRLDQNENEWPTECGKIKHPRAEARVHERPALRHANPC